MFRRFAMFRSWIYLPFGAVPRTVPRPLLLLRLARQLHPRERQSLFANAPSALGRLVRVVAGERLR